MRLDRNYGVGKYGLIKNRVLHDLHPITRAKVDEMLLYLAEVGVLEQPGPGDEGEFFAIRLRDKYAAAALASYATEAFQDDPDYARDIHDLVARAGPHSPFCKRPD